MLGVDFQGYYFIFFLKVLLKNRFLLFLLYIFFLLWLSSFRQVSWILRIRIRMRKSWRLVWLGRFLSILLYRWDVGQQQGVGRQMVVGGWGQRWGLVKSFCFCQVVDMLALYLFFEKFCFLLVSVVWFFQCYYFLDVFSFFKVEDVWVSRFGGFVVIGMGMFMLGFYLFFQVFMLEEVLQNENFYQRKVGFLVLVVLFDGVGDYIR